MAWLPNNGDVILDAVLTDEGRKRLARGTFNIVKFAFEDSEIDYSLFQNSNHTTGAHVSGSAYYDLNILQTPIMEAMTNNFSSMKSLLMTITSPTILYLPVLKLNEQYDPSTAADATTNMFLVAVNEGTEQVLGDSFSGVMYGYSLQGGSYVRLEQGWDTTEVAATKDLPTNMKEEEYGISIDSRLGFITQKQAQNRVSVSYIDDDEQAFYWLTKTQNPDFVKDMPKALKSSQSTQRVFAIRGPRGTSLEFGIGATDDLRLSDYMFDKIGLSVTMDGTNYKAIDTNVRVSGLTTGYHIDVPVRFLKEE